MTEGVKRRRSFPGAFKREAVAAIHGGRSVSQVAAELGLPDRLVRSWLRWAEGRSPGASGVPAPTPRREQAAPARRVGPSSADQAAKIAQLRKELERVRMERDISKRAALIFGQPTVRQRPYPYA
jgi:transposase